MSVLVRSSSLSTHWSSLPKASENTTQGLLDTQSLMLGDDASRRIVLMRSWCSRAPSALYSSRPSMKKHNFDAGFFSTMNWYTQISSSWPQVQGSLKCDAVEVISSGECVVFGAFFKFDLPINCSLASRTWPTSSGHCRRISKRIVLCWLFWVFCCVVFVVLLFF